MFAKLAFQEKRMVRNIGTAFANLNLFRRVGCAAALVLALSSQAIVKGQTATNVALKGSFASSVTDGVDIFSGKLEQVFPLITLRGRGEINQGLYLPLRNSEWHVAGTSSSTNNDRTYYYYRAEQGNYANNYARGVYSTLGKFEVITRYTGWNFMQTFTLTTIKFTSNGGG